MNEFGTQGAASGPKPTGNLLVRMDRGAKMSASKVRKISGRTLADSRDFSASSVGLREMAEAEALMINSLGTMVMRVPEGDDGERMRAQLDRESDIRFVRPES